MPQARGEPILTECHAAENRGKSEKASLAERENEVICIGTGSSQTVGGGVPQVSCRIAISLQSAIRSPPHQTRYAIDHHLQIICEKGHAFYRLAEWTFAAAKTPCCSERPALSLVKPIAPSWQCCYRIEPYFISSCTRTPNSNSLASELSARFSNPSPGKESFRLSRNGAPGYGQIPVIRYALVMPTQSTFLYLFSAFDLASSHLHACTLMPP